METPKTEAELVELAHRGDRQAFDTLLDQHRDRVLAFIRTRLGTRLRRDVEVEDIFQESCLKAFCSIDRFEYRGDGSLFVWLAAIAEHEIRALGRSSKQNVFGLDRDPASSRPSPSRVLRREERFDRLESALESLSVDNREVIQLARIEGLSIAEVAQRMNRTPGAVRHLLLRALQKLRTNFGEDTASLGLPGKSLDHEPGGTDEE